MPGLAQSSRSTGASSFPDADPQHRLNEDGARELQLMRWGLVPAWAKSASAGFSPINAKVETQQCAGSVRRELGMSDAGRKRGSFQARRFPVPIQLQKVLRRIVANGYPFTALTEGLEQSPSANTYFRGAAQVIFNERVGQAFWFSYTELKIAASRSS